MGTEAQSRIKERMGIAEQLSIEDILVTEAQPRIKEISGIAEQWRTLVGGCTKERDLSRPASLHAGAERGAQGDASAIGSEAATGRDCTSAERPAGASEGPGATEACELYGIHPKPGNGPGCTSAGGPTGADGEPGMVRHRKSYEISCESSTARLTTNDSPERTTNDHPPSLTPAPDLPSSCTRPRTNTPPPPSPSPPATPNPPQHLKSEMLSPQRNEGPALLQPQRQGATLEQTPQNTRRGREGGGYRQGGTRPSMRRKETNTSAQHTTKEAPPHGGEDAAATRDARRGTGSPAAGGELVGRRRKEGEQRWNESGEKGEGLARGGGRAGGSGRRGNDEGGRGGGSGGGSGDGGGGGNGGGLAAWMIAAGAPTRHKRAINAAMINIGLMEAAMATRRVWERGG
jgi:hypothetical protein